MLRTNIALDILHTARGSKEVLFPVSKKKYGRITIQNHRSEIVNKSDKLCYNRCANSFILQLLFFPEC